MLLCFSSGYEYVGNYSYYDNGNEYYANGTTTINISSYPNYQNISASNIYIAVKKIRGWGEKNNGSNRFVTCTPHVSSYNSTNGTVSLAGLSGDLTGDDVHAWACNFDILIKS